MGPLELSSRITLERKRVEDWLRASREEPGDYAQAYGELRAVAEFAARETAALDPAFTLITADDAEIDAFEQALEERRR